MKVSLVILAAVFCCTSAFDVDRFKTIFCKDTKDNITCSNFSWSVQDKDDVNKQNFKLSDAPAVFFVNANIGILNENLINKFPNAVQFSIAGGSFSWENSDTSISTANTKLTKLTIQGCKIQKNENSKALAKLSNLKQFSVIGSIMDMPVLDDVLLAMNINLEEVTFSQVPVGRVTTKAFFNLKKLVKLTLSDLLLMIVESSFLVNNVALKELDLSYTKMNIIPLPNFFPKTLEKINLSNNNIRSVSSKHFEGLTKLADLNLGFNAYLAISPDAFKPMGPALKILKFSAQTMVPLTRQHFSSNVNLEELQVGSKTPQTFSNDLFDDLGKLHKLDFN